MRGLWLIDGSYIFKAMRNFQRQNPSFQSKNIDYCRLRDNIKKALSIEQLDAYYFNSTPSPATDAQNQFHTWLKTVEPKGPNIRVKLYGLKNINKQCSYCKKPLIYEVQKGVDVGLVITGMRLFSRFDCIVLSAGDGDFEDFIRYVVEENDKRVYIVGFNGSISPDIQQYSLSTYFLNDHYTENCDTRQFTPFDGADELIDYDV